MTGKIQIDDAGWGCLLFGTIIGAYRTDTQKFAWGEIPVRLFQGEAFAQKRYLDGAVEVARGLLKELEATKEHPIEICSGYVLSEIRAWLSREGYSWKPARIGDPLQSLVERVLLEKLQALSIPVTYKMLTEDRGTLFRECLRWLKGGDLDRCGALPEREALAKTGWGSYPIWRNHPWKEACRLARERRERRRQAWRGHWA